MFKKLIKLLALFTIFASTNFTPIFSMENDPMEIDETCSRIDSQIINVKLNNEIIIPIDKNNACKNSLYFATICTTLVPRTINNKPLTFAQFKDRVVVYVMRLINLNKITPKDINFPEGNFTIFDAWKFADFIGATKILSLLYPIISVFNPKNLWSMSGINLEFSSFNKISEAINFLNKNPQIKIIKLKLKFRDNKKIKYSIINNLLSIPNVCNSLQKLELNNVIKHKQFKLKKQLPRLQKLIFVFNKKLQKNDLFYIGTSAQGVEKQQISQGSCPE